MPLILKRDPAGQGYEYYLVYEGDVAVGRIFQQFAQTGLPGRWHWSVTFQPAWEQPTYGTAATREAAMAAFKERWERGGPAPQNVG
jgi:hypothetical protein